MTLIYRHWRPGVQGHRGRPSFSDPGRPQRSAEPRVSSAERYAQRSLISLAALIGTEVRDPEKRRVGRLTDVVVDWTDDSAYPVARAITMRSGKLEEAVTAHWFVAAPPASVVLRSSSAFVKAPARRPGDVALAHDVLDRQLLDADGVEVLRPADVYLAAVGGRIEVVGIDVGIAALLRRLGPKRLRSRVRAERIVDWAEVRSFAPARRGASAGTGRNTALAGTAGSVVQLDADAGELHRLRAEQEKAVLDAHRHPRGEGGR